MSDFSIAPETGAIFFGKEPLKFGKRLRSLMTAFIEAKGEILTRAQLAEKLGGKIQLVTASTYVNRLSKKLSAELKRIDRAGAAFIDSVGYKGWRLVVAGKTSAQMFEWMGFSFAGNGENGIFFQDRKIELPNLERKLFAFLLRRRGEEVLSAELCNEIFPGTPVEEKSLQAMWHRLASLRERLVEEGFDEGLIAYAGGGFHKSGSYRVDAGKIPEARTASRPDEAPLSQPAAGGDFPDATAKLTP